MEMEEIVGLLKFRGTQHKFFKFCFFFIVSQCMQTKSEGKLFERFNINWKFEKLISTIIQKSWPRDRHGSYQQDEQAVLRHLLSWSAAKEIFKLYGISEKKTFFNPTEIFCRVALIILVKKRIRADL